MYSEILEFIAAIGQFLLVLIHRSYDGLVVTIVHRWQPGGCTASHFILKEGEVCRGINPTDFRFAPQHWKMSCSTSSQGAIQLCRHLLALSQDLLMEQKTNKQTNKQTTKNKTNKQTSTHTNIEHEQVFLHTYI